MAPGRRRYARRRAFLSSATRIIYNDHAVKCRGPDRLALTPFAHQHPRGARSAAGAIAADGVLPTIHTVQVGRAHVARVNLGELALTADSASTPPTRVEHRAVVVKVAGSGTALALATLVTRKTFDDRRDTKTLKAGIGDTGVVVLAPAVAMVFA